MIYDLRSTDCSRCHSRPDRESLAGLLVISSTGETELLGQVSMYD